MNIKNWILLGVLMVSILSLVSLQTQTSTNQGLISDKYLNIQHQNDWIVLQEYNDTSTGNYLLRNATYFIPIDQSEAGKSVTMYVESNNWDLFYVKNINLNLIYQIITPSGYVSFQGAFDGSKPSFSFNFNTTSSGIWKVIFFLDFAHMIPQDTTHRAEINVDIEVAVANVTAAVSFIVNEYDSTVGYVTQDVSLRSLEFLYSVYFYINTTQTDNLIFTLFGTNSIDNVTLLNNFTESYSFDFSNYADFSNPISKPIHFEPVNEGIWELDIYFNPYTTSSLLTMQFQNNLFNPITLYLNPPNNSTLFVDNNYDSVNDVNLTSVKQLYLARNQANSGSLSTLQNNTILTTTPLPIETIMFGVIVLGFRELRKRYKY